MAEWKVLGLFVADGQETLTEKIVGYLQKQPIDLLGQKKPRYWVCWTSSPNTRAENIKFSPGLADLTLVYIEDQRPIYHTKRPYTARKIANRIFRFYATTEEVSCWLIACISDT